MRSSLRSKGLVVALSIAMALPCAFAGPPAVVGGPLYDEIVAMPEGQWRLVSRNLYSQVWTPAGLRPLNGLSVSPPSTIIAAWSSFAWDTKRGALFLYGGGHANYSGNDTYLFRSADLSWHRASLPSEITELFNSNAFAPVDGPDNAPGSSHTYDNTLYLPYFDRFLTFGGALFNTGGNFAKADEANPGSIRATGPYLFDPSKADPNKVGGTTGSHVRRTGEHPEIVGGQMWQNRDLVRNRPSDAKPTKYVSGCTAYAEEDGYDVVYIGATGGAGTNRDLFRYTLRDVNDPTNDTMQKVGRFWNGTSGHTACGYDPLRKLFVLIGTPTVPFVFWDLNTAGPSNRDQRVQMNDSLQAFVDEIASRNKKPNACGMDFDPGDRSFVLWCGSAAVYRLRPPPTNVPSGWTIEKEPVSGASAPTNDTGTGILGKWKYIPGYDVFMALQDANAGNVWVWKPRGWTPPGPEDAVNWAPTVSLTAPANGSQFLPATPITLTADAADSDGTIARVEFWVNGSKVGTDSSPPYSFNWTPPAAGNYTLQARSYDNHGAEAYSAVASIVVAAAPSNVPPTVTLTAPPPGTIAKVGIPVSLTANAQDSDGTVTIVEFFAGVQKVGEDNAAPYEASWTPTQAGRYTLVARATDNGGASTSSASVTIDVEDDVDPGPTQSVVLQNGINGYAGATDTWLTAFYPNSNYGSSTTLSNHANNAVSMIRFAVFASEGGPVPDGAQIVSAKLEIYKLTYNYVYRLHALLRDWSESQASWNRASSTELWTEPGARGVGTDYAATADAEFSAGWDPGWMTFDVTERVRAYASGTPNRGWRVVGVSGYNTERKFYSTEFATIDLRPRLTVRYTIP